MFSGGSRSTKPCVFPCKVAAAGDERYLVCAAVAAAVLWRSWWDPLCRVLAWRSCRCLVLDACMKALMGGSWGVLVPRSCKILFRSSRSFCHDLAKFSSGPWHEDLGLLQFLVCRPCRILMNPPKSSLQCMILLPEVFAWSCPGPCEKILKRYWWNPLGVLASSRAGPCEKILWRPCWNHPQDVLALRSWRCFALVLAWRSSKILCIEGPSLTILWNSLRCPGRRF